MTSFESKREILVLDNDECLGNFSSSSLMMNMFIKYIETTTHPEKTNIPLHEYYSNMVFPYIDLFVNYLEKGLARPYLKEFIQKMYQLKLECKIKKIVMYTATSNRFGWVTFLSKLIPIYANVPLDFYDEIFTRDHCMFRNKVYIKHLNYVDSNTSKIVMIDDLPDQIISINALIIPVSKYLKHVSLLNYNFMCYFEEKYHNEFINAIKKDELLYPIDTTTDYSSDNELLIIMEQLIQLFK